MAWANRYMDQFIAYRRSRCRWAIAAFIEAPGASSRPGRRCRPGPKQVDTRAPAPIIGISTHQVHYFKYLKMLRITKLTDYAVLVLSDMVRMEAQAHAARDIAERTLIPQPTVSKVLKLLGRAALVASERGKNGGYRLARAPGNISGADIVDAVEGAIAVTEG